MSKTLSYLVVQCRDVNAYSILSYLSKMPIIVMIYWTMTYSNMMYVGHSKPLWTPPLVSQRIPTLTSFSYSLQFFSCMGSWLLFAHLRWILSPQRPLLYSTSNAYIHAPLKEWTLEHHSMVWRWWCRSWNISLWRTSSLSGFDDCRPFVVCIIFILMSSITSNCHPWIA